MPIVPVDGIAYPTSEELLAQTLADMRFIASGLGRTIAVEEGSDNWIKAKAFCQRASIAIANGENARKALNPLSIDDFDDMVLYAAVYGVHPRPAAKASGEVIIKVTGGGSVIIPDLYEGQGPNGEIYQTNGIQTQSNGLNVNVIAKLAGSAGNLAAGAQGQWLLSTVGNLASSWVVAAGDIDGGTPDDDIETLRRRLIRRLAFPGVGGSWSQIVGWAEEASSAIQAAYVYSVRGPASYDVAIIGSTGDRALSTTVQDQAKNKILSNMPGNMDLNVTSVNPYLVDVIIDLELPLPVESGGAGGGWRDNIPWPSDAEAFPAKITNVAGAIITVNSTSADPPLAGNHFAVWDPATRSMKQFRISAVGGVSGAYTVTIDTINSDSHAFLAINMYVSAGAEAIVSYADLYANVLIYELGPGEKTNNVDILPYGRRLPGTESVDPASLSNVMLGKLVRGVVDDDDDDENPEITDYAYKARYIAGTTTPIVDTPIPTTTADPPRILNVQRLAFRRMS
jgi:uncharacterized phage protein gp47/JayE